LPNTQFAGLSSAVTKLRKNKAMFLLNLVKTWPCFLVFVKRLAYNSVKRSIMQRSCVPFLRQWLISDNRKPLVIRGARQVGKTWLVRHLAESSGKKLIEINLEKYPKLASVFSSNDPQLIVKQLGSALETHIDPLQSLLFIDEIQETPELFSKLRWFAEDMPQLPVIAAGSLLEFVLGKQALSMPVGRISYMYLEPLSFEEFLMAHERHELLDQIKTFSFKEGISEFAHEKLIGLFKEYVIIGGMPAAVATWITTQSLPEVSRIHNDIMRTYRDDFGKYSGRIPIQRLNEIVTSVPKRLGEKFVYTAVNPDVRLSSIKDALELLCQAKLCHLIKATSANGVPLAAEVIGHYIKVILLDVGLISAELGLSLHELDSIQELDLVNKGGLAEQVVGQLFRTISPNYQEPVLYYWLSTEKHASAELDFVIQHGSKVVPVEVKAGSTGTLKSLHRFMHLKKLSLALRISSAMPMVSTVRVNDTQGTPISYELRSLPFYLISQVHRLLGPF
jgi:predicted AAA+ superfamily ATPase